MGNTLPLDNSSISSVAAIGPNANSINVMWGNYHGTPPFTITAMDGLSMFVGIVDYEEGVQINSANTTGIAAAVKAAQSADVTILVMGLDQSQESEGHDRTNIAMPGQQNNLISQVSKAAKGSVILVILSGGSVDISEWRDSNDVDAIICRHRRHRSRQLCLQRNRSIHRHRQRCHHRHRL